MRQDTTEWTLVDWERECSNKTATNGAVVYAIFNEIKEQARQKKINWWKKDNLPRSTLSEWHTRGVPGKDNAMIMMSILRRIASRHRQTWFSNETIATDADKFLNSKACRDRGQHFLTKSEIEEICQLVPIDQRVDSFRSLYRRLFPPPPEVLHGRSSAVEAIKRSIKDNVVTVITALPGQGKTSLAWHVAVDLVMNGCYEDFDWTTHKYTQIDVRTGERRETNPVRWHTPDPQKSKLCFDDVLVSMIYRFQWLDARAMSPLDRKNKCAELLASRRYLVVLDNLETLPDIQHAVEYFSRLKGYGLTDFNSRILITSRHEVYGSNIKLFNLEGIDSDGVDAFFTDLALELNYTKPYDSLRWLKLWEVCQGNPLLMMISFYRLSLGHRFEDLIQSIEKASGDFETIFHNLFSELLSELNPAYVLLAKVAAVANQQGIAMSFAGLQTAWNERIYPEYAAGLGGTPQYTFSRAIHELRKYHIINASDGGEYAMHPFIRAYLSR